MRGEIGELQGIKTPECNVTEFQLVVLLLEDEEEGGKEIETDRPFEEENSAVQLSLHSIVGFTSRRSLKAWGKIGRRRVMVLVDCGATHNFISTELVKELNLPITQTPSYSVEVGDGRKIQCQGASFDDLTMKIKIGEQKKLLMGEPQLTRSAASLKSMLKALGNQGEGFLVGCQIMSASTEGEGDIPAAVTAVLEGFPKFNDLDNWQEEVQRDGFLKSIIQDLITDPNSHAGYALKDQKLFFKGQLVLPKGSPKISKLIQEQGCQ
ncbi:Aspartic peptidase domain superfamily [Sesbania bispinosa]|nr:Aspartic peptidase domain superfamily [Sesbania bispinosa]